MLRCHHHHCQWRHHTKQTFKGISTICVINVSFFLAFLTQRNKVFFLKPKTIQNNCIVINLLTLQPNNYYTKKCFRIVTYFSDKLKGRMEG